MQAVAELLNNLRSRARHLEMSGQPGEAAVVYQQVARQALASSAYTVGRSALQRALALLPPEPSILRAETLLELAQVNFILDEGEHQAMLIGEAQQIAATLDHAELRTRAALAAAEWATKTGDDQNAAEALHQARSLAHQTGLPHLEAEALYLSGDLALRLGQLPEARARYEQQLAVAQQARLRDQQAAALEGIGYVLADSGGADDQVFSYLHAALEIRRELGDRYREAQATNSLLSVLQAAGRLDEALLMGEQALALNQEIGYVRGAAIVRGNLAMSAAALGEFERARSLINAVRTYFMEVDDLDAVGLYTDTLGWIEERSGHLELAESLLREAIARLEASGASFFAALAKLDLSHLYVRQERYTEARPLLEGAITVFEANQAAMELERCRALLGLALLHDDQPAQAAQLAETSWQVFQSGAPQGEERQYYLWALWQLLQAVGRSQPAQIILEEAYQTLLRQAALLDDLAARQGFFQNVPVNHEISLAWQQQQGHVCQIKMRLACLSAPLGRPLTEADTIEIGWTVVAPEDETIPDKGERRLHVLRRLLSQAARQGAAPTDDDLAEALGVSRRTILRDMQILEAQGVARPTRKRKTTGE